MVDAVWEHLLPGSRRRHGDPGRRSPLPGLVALLRWATALVALVLLGWGLVSEARTSYLQSRLLMSMIVCDQILAAGLRHRTQPVLRVRRQFS